MLYRPIVHGSHRRHSPYDSRLATSHFQIWGSLRPDGAITILKVLLVSSQVAIESLLSNMSLRSLRIANAKIQNKKNNRAILEQQFAEISK